MALIPSLEAVCATRPGTVLHRLERNLGTAGGRNRGVSLAESELVLFLDDDAEMLPGALAHLLAELDRNPDAVAVTATVFRPDGTIIHSGGAMDVSDEIVTFELLGDGQKLSAEMPPPSGRSGWMPRSRRAGASRRVGGVPDRRADERLLRGQQLVAHRLTDATGRLLAFPGGARPAPPVPEALDHGRFHRAMRDRQLLQSYARFYARHGVLLGPWLFDHVPELRADDGSCDLAGARLLMELVIAKGPDWILMEWMNGDLDGLLCAERGS